MTNLPAAGADSVESLEHQLTQELTECHLLDAEPTCSSSNGFRSSLEFRCDFDSGNLGRIDQITEFEYDVFIRPDTCSMDHRVWFYFSVKDAAGSLETVKFNIVNLSKQRTLFESGSAVPVVKTLEDKPWLRMPGASVSYKRSTAHDGRFILSLDHQFIDCTEVHFAYCFPFTLTKVQTHLHSILSRYLPHVTSEILTKSVQGRDVELITIAGQKYGSIETTEKVVFITARVHPGETPASFVCQGLMDFLVSNDSVAIKARNEFSFKIVPVLNPDGVQLGNYRCSFMGSDLNRQYAHPSHWAHPSIFAVRQYLLNLRDRNDAELFLYVDIHGHSQKMNSFLYGNVHGDPYNASYKDEIYTYNQKQLLLPHIMAELCDDFSLDNTQFNMDARKDGAGRRAVGAIFGTSALCYTLEVSFFSYVPNSSSDATSVPYTEEKYLSLGRNLGHATSLLTECSNGRRAALNITRPFETFVKGRISMIKRKVRPSTVTPGNNGLNKVIGSNSTSVDTQPDAKGTINNNNKQSGLRFGAGLTPVEAMPRCESAPRLRRYETIGDGGGERCGTGNEKSVSTRKALRPCSTASTRRNIDEKCDVDYNCARPKWKR